MTIRRVAYPEVVAIIGIVFLCLALTVGGGFKKCAASYKKAMADTTHKDGDGRIIFSPYRTPTFLPSR